MIYVHMNSMRILPHKQDTGGFFIALLAKVRAPRPLTDEEHKALRGNRLSYVLHSIVCVLLY
jgi:hypothetical protein